MTHRIGNLVLFVTILCSGPLVGALACDPDDTPAHDIDFRAGEEDWSTTKWKGAPITSDAFNKIVGTCASTYKPTWFSCSFSSQPPDPLTHERTVGLGCGATVPVAYYDCMIAAFLSNGAVQVLP